MSSGPSLRGIGWVTAGSLAANLVSYLLHIPAGRVFGPAGYSEFAALLAAQMVLAVPAIAVQNVIARSVVQGAGAAAVRRLTLGWAGAFALFAILAGPVAARMLRTDLWTAEVALLAAPLLIFIGGEQGVAQGEARFRRFSAMILSVSVLKVAPAAVAIMAGGSVFVVMAVMTLGTAAGALATRLLAGPDVLGDDAPLALASVLRASQVQAVVIALTSVDLLAARYVLDADDAGIYALGAVAAKVAFWLPQAVATVLYPRMADATESRRAVRTAQWGFALIGLVVVAGAAIASPIVPKIFGSDYAATTGWVWLFALQGAALAFVQASLVVLIARERTGFALTAWVGLAVELALIPFVHAIGTLLAVAVGVALAVAATTAVAARIASRPEPGTLSV